CVQHQKLRWLGHVLRMPNHRLPKRVLFSMPNSEWARGSMLASARIREVASPKRYIYDLTQESKPH
ncbi:hypothetical protein T265_10616, partial [Opisthorchis viverrini]